MITKIGLSEVTKEHAVDVSILKCSSCNRKLEFSNKYVGDKDDILRRDADQSGGAMYTFRGTPVVVNSILWGDTPEEIADDGGSATKNDPRVGDKGTSSFGTSGTVVTTTSVTASRVPSLDVSLAGT